MHQGQWQYGARGLLARKVDVAEGHRLAGADRPVEDSKIGSGSLRQIPVPIGSGTHVQQLINAAEKGGFGVGFREAGQRRFGGCRGYRIAAVACKGKPAKG